MRFKDLNQRHLIPLNFNRLHQTRRPALGAEGSGVRIPPPQPVEIIDIPSVIDNFVNRPDTHRTSVDEYLGDFALTERFKKQGAQPGVVVHFSGRPSLSQIGPWFDLVHLTSKCK